MHSCSCAQNSVKLSDLKEVLVLGGEASGKTTLIRGMINKNNKWGQKCTIPEKHIPTCGVEVDVVRCGRHLLKMREIGYAFYENWDLYFNYCDMVLYLLDDSLQTENLKKALDDLMGVLKHVDIENKPVILLWTKDKILETKKKKLNRRKIHNEYVKTDVPTDYVKTLSQYKTIRIDTRDKEQIKEIMKEIASIVPRIPNRRMAYGSSKIEEHEA